ncbi:20413_t:CDS:2, partial [Rhizophagus irregularis]
MTWTLQYGLLWTFSRNSSFLKFDKSGLYEQGYWSQNRYHRRT